MRARVTPKSLRRRNDPASLSCSQGNCVMRYTENIQRASRLCSAPAHVHSVDDDEVITDCARDAIDLTRLLFHTL